jgi:Zn-dependent metalloprotease
MKKHLLLSLAILPVWVYGQQLTGTKANTQITGAREISYNTRTNAPAFVKFRTEQQPALSDFQTLSRSMFQMRTEDELQQIKVSKPDAIKMTHYTYQQKYNGIPVEWAITKVHEKNGKIVSVNGDYHQDIAVANTIGISADQALIAAKNNIGALKYKWEMKDEEAFLKTVLNKPDFSYNPKTQMVVLPISKEEFRYAYKLDIYAHEPEGRWDVYVDAQDGSVLKKINKICDADVKGTAQTKYHGLQTLTTDSIAPNSFILRENDRKGRGMEIETRNAQRMDEWSNPVDFTDTDNFWDNANAFHDDAATDAHYAAENTYDYYLDSLGRDSYDDNGTKLTLFIHVDQNWFNAQWTGSYSRYGDGNGQPLTSVDVVSHEITHGVTQESAGLIYQSESGALNESFSDIFGTVVEFYSVPSTAKWIMGEGNFQLRNLANPNAFTNPDTYGGINWTNTVNCTPSNTNDWCGVHNNSGVQNFWFFLLVNGGAGTNDIGNAFNVTGIGMSKAAKIAYRNLATYLTFNSDYKDARQFSIEAAIDLYGENSPELIAVTNAWYAVGVGKEYTSIPVADFFIEDPTCKRNIDMQFRNTSGSARSYLWQFGDGQTSTATEPIHSYSSDGEYTVKLIATNINGSDTLTKEKLVNIFSDEVISASCTPSTVSNCCNAGIFNFKLNDIDYSSGNALTEGYQDFACQRTSLAEGNTYPISITTNPNSIVYTRVWIDFDNNGLFNESERVFATDSLKENHQGSVIIPTGAQLNTPLRLRVISALYDGFNEKDDPCHDIRKGQAEDYSVIITNGTGTGHISLQDRLKIYPNPSNSIVNIELSGWSGQTEMILTDILGKEILKQSFNDKTVIDVSDLPKSLYFIKIKSGNDQVVQKVIVK